MTPFSDISRRGAFAGWRYFDFAAYRETVDARINLEASGEDEARA